MGIEERHSRLAHTHADLAHRANLWMVERSNAEARDISDRAGDIFNAVCLVAERMESVGASLSQTTKRYNEAVKSLVGDRGCTGK